MGRGGLSLKGLCTSVPGVELPVVASQLKMKAAEVARPSCDSQVDLPCSVVYRITGLRTCMQATLG